MKYNHIPYNGSRMVISSSIHLTLLRVYESINLFIKTQRDNHNKHCIQTVMMHNPSLLNI